MKIAILGAGGLGKAAAQIIEQKDEMQLVAVADAEGFIHAPQSVNTKDLLQVKAGGSVAALAGGESTQDSIGKVIALKDQVDGVFLALPNLPNNFIPGIVDRFLDAGFQGVFSDAQVTVGGVMDTRSAQKPVSTTMTLTGITFEGKRSEHKFILGDETSMAANVCGPALGYLKRAHWLRERGVHGVFGSAEMMPMVVK